MLGYKIEYYYINLSALPFRSSYLGVKRGPLYSHNLKSKKYFSNLN